MAGRKAKTAPETTEAPKRRGRPPKNAAEKAVSAKTTKTAKTVKAEKTTKSAAGKATGRGRKKAGGSAQLLSGSQIVIECLKEQGVDTVFGYPGGTILNIYDELYKHSNEIHHVLTSHEQGAAHAADGYARATGKTGVVISNLCKGILQHTV